MIKGMESILLGSQDAKKLAQFYKDTVGLKTTMEAELGENNEDLFGFENSKGSAFYIMDHSKVKEKSKDPNRIILNFEVDDIDREMEKLKKAKVKLIQDKYHIQDYGFIATFMDPDGNYFQFVQIRAKSN